ncbi:MAG: OmpA family protein [Muribaculaceae bacterium]
MKTRALSTLSILLAISLLTSSCDFLSNTDKGYVAGTIGGTILGAGLGAAFGGDHGADIGAHIGMAVGGVTGAAIGANEDAKQAQKAAKAQKRAQAAASSTDEGENTSYYDSATGLYYTKVSRDNQILFNSRSCDLNGRACKEIIRIAAELHDTPFAGIMIYGSTDDTESRDYSMELSEERAETVRDYFVQIGFDPNLLNTVGLGSQYPVADNSTLDGRARNRCVEVYIINSKQ